MIKNRFARENVSPSVKQFITLNFYQLQVLLIEQCKYLFFCPSWSLNIWLSLSGYFSLLMCWWFFLRRDDVSILTIYFLSHEEYIYSNSEPGFKELLGSHWLLPFALLSWYWILKKCFFFFSAQYGGMAGFVLGSSFLTVFEIFYFILKLVYKCVDEVREMKKNQVQEISILPGSPSQANLWLR